MAAELDEGDFRMRYEHLLKPIRDLSENWNVNIAKDLEDYLEELENIQITFDDGKTSINFAEAALILQGSAHVYSKKVEYLYALVMDCQKAVISRREKKGANQAGQGNDADDEAAGWNDEEDDFLPLDDIEEGTNIDLPPEEAEYIHKYIFPMAKLPFSLVKLDDMERGEYPLLSEKGEVIGNRKDFKMNTAVVTECGAMLLDQTHQRFLDASLAEGALNAGSDQGGPLKKVIAELQTLSTSRNSNEDNQPDSSQPDAVEDDVPMMSINTSGADDNDNGMDLPEPSLGPGEHEEERNAMQRETRGAAQTDNAPLLDDSFSDCESEYDPFEDKLDPHQDTTADDKPLKKCVTWRLPARLKEMQKKRKRNQDAVKDSYKLMPLPDFYEKNFYPRDYKLPRACSKDLEQLYWPEHKKRTALIKDKKQRYLQKMQKNLAEAKRRRNRGLEATCNEQIEELMRDEEPHEEPQDEPAGAAFSEDDDHDLPLPLADDAAMDRALAETAQLAREHSQDLDQVGAEDWPVIQRYEDLVRHHVDLFMRQAHKDAHQTEMTRRVEEWEEKIMPRLEAEESHDPFDIHKSGSTILDSVSENIGGQNPAIPFRLIVRGCPEYEVCRLFSAALQLANSGNIEIGTEGGDAQTIEEKVDKMTVRLLSRRRHHEELADFKAPSVTTSKH